MLFCNYLPLEKCMALHLNKFESPLPNDALCQVWLKLVKWFWRRRWKSEKFTNEQMDDRQQVIRKACLSFQLRWAKTFHSDLGNSATCMLMNPNKTLHHFFGPYIDFGGNNLIKREQTLGKNNHSSLSCPQWRDCIPLSNKRPVRTSFTKATILAEEMPWTKIVWNWLEFLEEKKVYRQMNAR